MVKYDAVTFCDNNNTICILLKYGLYFPVIYGHLPHTLIPAIILNWRRVENDYWTRFCIPGSGRLNVHCIKCTLVDVAML